MKKLLPLIFLISSASFAQQSLTRTAGDKVTLIDGSDHTITLTNAYKDTGCIWVTLEVISCNAAGVQFTVATGNTAGTFTNSNANAALSKTLIRYCFAPPNISATPALTYTVKIHIKGTTGDVIKISY